MFGGMQLDPGLFARFDAEVLAAFDECGGRAAPSQWLSSPASGADHGATMSLRAHTDRRSLYYWRPLRSHVSPSGGARLSRA